MGIVIHFSCLCMGASEAPSGDCFVVARTQPLHTFRLLTLSQSSAGGAGVPQNMFADAV